MTAEWSYHVARVARTVRNTGGVQQSRIDAASCGKDATKQALVIPVVRDVLGYALFGAELGHRLRGAR